MLAKKQEWSHAAGAGALGGGRGGAPKRGARVTRSEGVEGAAQRRAAQPCHQAVCVPRSWCTPVTSSSPDKEVGPSPLGSRPRLEQTLHWVPVFQKSSITCPFPTPTQVGHPATSPLPCPGRGCDRPGLPPGAPATLPLGRYSESCVATRLPGSCGKRSLGRGTRGLVFAPAEGLPGPGLSPSQGLRVRQPVFCPRQAPGQSHTEVLPPPVGFSVPRCGAVCVRVCVLRFSPGVQESAQGPLWRDAGALASPSDPPGGWQETPAGPSVSGSSLPPGCLGDTQFSFRIRQCGGQAPRARG